MKKRFHIFSQGDNVLFRDNNDYSYFCNRFGMLSIGFHMNPLMVVTMSTHFHAIVEPSDTDDIAGFLKALKRLYRIHYARKYSPGIPIKFETSVREILDYEMYYAEMLYGAKNPVHHYVCNFPLSYRYSSISYLFSNCFMPDFDFAETRKNLTRFSDLSARQQKEVASNTYIPDDWRIDDNGLISFDSYIKTNRARALWDDNVKVFLYDMNKNPKDAAGNLINSDVQDLRCSRLDDIRVCKIIDSYTEEIGARSFHHIKDKYPIIRKLEMKGIPNSQIRRCLWID